MVFFRDLLKLFTTREIMRWKDVVQTYETELRTKHPGNTVFDPKTEEGQKRWGDLKIRVVEHVSGGKTTQIHDLCNLDSKFETNVILLAFESIIYLCGTCVCEINHCLEFQKTIFLLNM